MVSPKILSLFRGHVDLSGMDGLDFAVKVCEGRGVYRAVHMGGFKDNGGQAVSDFMAAVEIYEMIQSQGSDCVVETTDAVKKADDFMMYTMHREDVPYVAFLRGWMLGNFEYALENLYPKTD